MGELNVDNLGFPVGVGTEIEYLRSLGACRQIVLPVAGNGLYVEALDIGGPGLAVDIGEVVGRAVVALLPDVDMDDVLADKDLLGDARYEEFAVLPEDDDVVQVGTIGDEGILFEPVPDEALLGVDVQLNVVGGHLRRLDLFERSDRRAALLPLAVLVQQVLKIGNGIIV